MGIIITYLSFTGGHHMHNNADIPLVVSEITGVWNNYMYDSMSVCVLRYFLNNAADDETRGAIQYALNLSNEHISVLTDIFKQEKLPLPDGFSDKDVDMSAPPLFTDAFYLLYISYMSRIGLQDYSLTLNHIARSDIRKYFSSCIAECVDLYNMLTDLRLSKGIFIRAPRVEVSKTVQYIMEGALASGFNQVCTTKEVVDFMSRAREMSAKLVKKFSLLLADEGIPIPCASDSFVTDSTVSPFSEKLMMFHGLALANTAVINYGMALARSVRGDLSTYYVRLLAETMNLIKDGSNIMIANGWMEQPPQVVRHENL
jgi:hypothetical protein